VRARLRRLFELPPDVQPLVRSTASVPIRQIVRRFWPYARPYRRRLALSLVFVVLVPVIEAVQIWMFKLAIDDVLVPRDLTPLVWIATVYLCLGVLAGLVSFANDYLSAWLGERFLLLLRASLFRHVHGGSDSTSSSAIGSGISSRD
jgi:ATP-binding cassette subfamily B protein